MTISELEVCLSLVLLIVALIGLCAWLESKEDRRGDD